MATRKIFLDDLSVGDRVRLGYRTHEFVSIFAGWKMNSGPAYKNPSPRAGFVDEDGTEWDAYLFEGKFCVGSSADALKVFEIIENVAPAKAG